MLSSLKNLPNRVKWIALFGLWILHGLAAFLQFQAISLSENSVPYFVVRMFLLAWIIINFILVILVYKNTLLWLDWQDILVRPTIKDGLFITASSLLILRICLWFFQGLIVPPLTQQVGRYLDLLRPLLSLAGYVSLEIIFIISFINIQINFENKKLFLRFGFSSIVVFFILGLIVLFVFMTGLGILPGYKGDWQRGLPAVALLEWQIFLACICCLAMFLVESKKKIVDIPHLDVWICVAIWLGASILWLSQPVIPNASALKPHGPNFEVYPFNDAQTYDEFAQSALIGNGFGADRIPQRPLYIVFLIFAHVLVGQDYNNVIFIQTLVFAMFPVLLYL